MNKLELVSKVAEKADMTKTAAAKAVEAVFDTISETLCYEEVALVGFGSVNITLRNARKGRNPKTGESIDIAASKVVKFAAGKQLRERIAAAE